MTFLSAPEVNSYRYDFLESVARYHPAVFCINDLRELHSPNPLPNCHPLPTAVPRWLLLSLIGQVDTKQKLKKKLRRFVVNKNHDCPIIGAVTRAFGEPNGGSLSSAGPQWIGGHQK